MFTMPRQFINLALALAVAFGSFGITALPAMADEGSTIDWSAERRGSQHDDERKNRGHQDGDEDEDEDEGRRGGGEERRGGLRGAVNGEVTAVTCSSTFSLKTRSGREATLSIIPDVTLFRYPGGERAQCSDMAVGTRVHVLAFRGAEATLALVVQLPKVRDRFAHKVGTITDLAGSTIELNDEFSADMSQSPVVQPSGYTPALGDRVLLLVRASGGGLPAVLLVVKLSGDTTPPPATASAALSSEVALTETNLDNRVLTVTLSGTAFSDSTLSAGNFTLNGAPAGVTISGVTWDSSTRALVTLDSTGADFDTNASISVTVDESELTTDADLTTNAVTVSAVIEQPQSATLSSSVPLTETNLNGRTLTVTLSNGAAFTNDALAAASFTLNGPPAGTTISGVVWDSSTQATLTLAHTGADFDTNTSLSVTVDEEELTGDSNLVTNTLTVTAVVEPAAATISADPALHETGLSGRIITLTLSQTAFVDNTLSATNFTLNGAPAGTTVGSVIHTSPTQAMVVLAYSGADFDANASMSLTVNGAELTGGTSVTSNALTVTATVEP